MLCPSITKFRIWQQNVYLIRAFENPVVWHFIGMEDTKNIEKVQYRVLTLNDFKSPYSILREQSGPPLLYVRRIRVLLIEIYKIYNLLGPMYLHRIVSKQADVTSTRISLRVVQPKCRTSTYGLNSVRYMVQCYGTGLIDKKSMSLEDFKRNIVNWTGPACTCSTCKLCFKTNVIRFEMYGATRFKLCLMVIMLITHLLRGYPHLAHLIPFRPICIMSVNSAGH